MDYEKLMARARAFALRRGYAGDADDFSQEAAIYALKHGQIRLDWVFTDYLRKTYGSSRTLKGDAERVAGLRAVRLDHEIDDSGEGSELLHSIVADTRNCPDSGFEFTDLLATLDPQDERDWFLVNCAFMGYTKKQMAKEIGISTSRVSQIFKAMIERSEQMEIALQFSKPHLRKWVRACYRKLKR